MTAERSQVTEQSFRVLVENSPDAILVQSDNIIVYANPACAHMLGLPSAGEMRGKSIEQFIEPSFVPDLKARIAEDYLRGTASAVHEHVLRRADGTYLAVEGRAIAIEWEGRRAIEVVIRDISERKRAEQALVDWEARLDIAEKLAPLGLWEWNVSTQRLKWSDRLREQFGYGPDSPRDLDEVLRRVHPDDLVAVEQAIDAVVTRDADVQLQYRVVCGETVRWLDARGVLLAGPEKRMIGAAIDITDLKESEARLRASEAKYRSIFENAPYGIYRSSPEGHFITVNRALLRMLGYDTRDEVLALDIGRDVYVNPEDRMEVVARTASSSEPIEMDVEWKRKDGSRFTVRHSAIALRDGHGRVEGFQVTVEDVSERKMLQQQLWRAQKMDAIGRLAGGVAHDFNNVLMIVGSYADLILQNDVGDPKIQRYAREIEQASLRAASVTRQLLAFSRKQILQPELVDANAVIGELRSILPKLLGEDVTVVIDLSPVPLKVSVDRGQLEQIVMNLAANSRDAMPHGGQFTIRTEIATLTGSDSPHRGLHPHEYVRLAISDTGTGMDSETKARLFEPFFTTKERGKGTGLGLATVYGITKQSGGSLVVTSEPGQGTTFELLFPLIKDSSGCAIGQPAVSALRGSETVLLIEDEEGLCAATCEFLESLGYRVLRACNGAEALRRCAHHHPSRVDAVVTDIVMPDIDGVGLVKLVRSLQPDVRVLYMSGYGDRAIHGLQPGAVLLQKPFSLGTLSAKLREVLDSLPPAEL